MNQVKLEQLLKVLIEESVHMGFYSFLQRLTGVSMGGKIDMYLQKVQAISIIITKEFNKLSEPENAKHEGSVTATE